jgi:hypothetical protein
MKDSLSSKKGWIYMYSRDRMVLHQTSLPLFCLSPSDYPSTVLSNTPCFCFRSCSMICLLQLCLVSSNGFGIQRECLRTIGSGRIDPARASCRGTRGLRSLSRPCRRCWRAPGPQRPCCLSSWRAGRTNLRPVTRRAWGICSGERGAG